MFLSSHYNHTSTYMTCMKTNDMVIENFSYSNSTNTTGVKELSLPYWTKVMLENIQNGVHFIDGEESSNRSINTKGNF